MCDSGGGGGGSPSGCRRPALLISLCPPKGAAALTSAQETGRFEDPRLGWRSGSRPTVQHVQAPREQHPRLAAAGGGEWAVAKAAPELSSLPAHLCRSWCGPSEKFRSEHPSVTLVPDDCPQCWPVNLIMAP